MPLLLLCLLCLRFAAGTDPDPATASAGTDPDPAKASAGTDPDPAKAFRPVPKAEVKSLPGFDGGAFLSRHYAGYLTVDAQRRRHLFYYFVKSENDPKNDPLVLWLNGGPGCSSLQGFVYEHGPFTFDYNDGDVKLSRNPHAWTKVASVIYLDSPAGAGMSYSEGVSRYKTDDHKTAEDLYAAVLKFLELFPDFAENEFFVAGESYGGIYAPMLVDKIVEGNKENPTTNINLIGYLVGNGLVSDFHDDWNVLRWQSVVFAHGKSLISDKMFNELQATCQENLIREMQASCIQLIDETRKKFFKPPLNHYHVAGKCDRKPEGTTTDDVPSNRTNWANALIEQNGWIWPPLGPLPAMGPGRNEMNTNPNRFTCTDYWTAEAWLNKKEVRKAIHAAPIETSGRFDLCSERIEYKRYSTSVFHLHKRFVTKEGLHALIYSGDHDLLVPHTHTEMWTTGLGLEVISPWEAWTEGDEQVGGYHIEYEGLTYCTIRNAGHYAPQTHPKQALEMFRRFLKQKSMDDPTEEPSSAAPSFVY